MFFACVSPTGQPAGAVFSRLALLRDVCVEEAEVNPLFVCVSGVVAVDALLRLAG